MEHLASAEFADAYVEHSDPLISPNRGQDTGLYRSPLDTHIAEILIDADAVRADVSGQMPSRVAGGFAARAIEYMTGTMDVEEFLRGVEINWP